MKYFIYLLVFLISGSFIYSCKTHKKILNKKNSEMSVIYDSITNRYLNYNTLLIKASTFFDNNKKKINLKATIKIKKDSVIIISLSPGLGIEAARIKFTTDSLFILDRFSSKVTKSNYTFINDTYKVSIGFNEIQSILTNELFIYPKMLDVSVGQEFINSFSHRDSSKPFDFYRKTDQLVENLISIKAEKYYINKYIINDIKNKRNLQIQFEDAYSNELGNLPKTIFVVSSDMDKIYKLKLNYSKISKNKKLNFSFKIPSKYESFVY